jgi:hypothetical protein
MMRGPGGKLADRAERFHPYQVSLGARQLFVRVPGFRVQARVLEGERGLIGEALRQLDLREVELAPGLVRHDERSHHPVLDDPIPYPAKAKGRLLTLNPQDA